MERKVRSLFINRHFFEQDEHAIGAVGKGGGGVLGGLRIFAGGGAEEGLGRKEARVFCVQVCCV